MSLPENSIKVRRAALGLTQQDVADRLGLTKSHVSHIEHGRRVVTDSQASSLAEMLGMPADLVLLSSGRLPKDVQGAIEADAAGVAAAIRARGQSHAISYPDAPLNPPAMVICDELHRCYADSGLPVVIGATKATTSYRAHSYHTKVPPAAISPFIDAYSRPGDWVCDPFCGSGMTGVAALMAGRRALLSDLSPAAVHIARNYTSWCDPVALKSAFDEVEVRVAPTMRWLYTALPCHDETIEYTTWSDVFLCSSCGEPIVYWDAAGSLEGDRLRCPSCQASLRKGVLRWVGETPVQTQVSRGSNRIFSRAPTEGDLALIAEVDAAHIPYWIPEVSFGSDREMWRAGHRAMGIDNVHGFYSTRNLHALAALRHAIIETAQGRVREALFFAFTACVNRASKRYQWNAKRPTNVMTGTLYVSSLRYEWNVWSLFRRKFFDVLKYYKGFPRNAAAVEVFQHSATNLDCIDSSSVDFVFMDPPFGSNIFYADSSLLWDSWLGTLTDQADEIVVNKHRPRNSGGKGIAEYGALMTSAFSEVQRILKPGGRSILAFSNADDQVWSAVQDAISDAGLDVRAVHLLDKGQPSIKGVKGQLGKEHVTRLDLMLDLAHRSSPRQRRKIAPPDDFIEKSIEAAVGTGATRTDHIYSLVLRDALQADFAVTGITMPMIAKRLSRTSATASREAVAEHA